MDGTKRILRTSEQTGFRHLYLMTHDDGWKYTSLTRGEWQVDDEAIYIDYLHQTVLFTGSKDSPLEKHLYSCSLTDPQQPPVRLTALGYSHTVTVSDEAQYFVSCYSNIETPPRTDLFLILHE